MYCPRCGVENDDSRAACWNCFAQLRPSADADARKPQPKPSKAERKKGKQEPIVEPVAAPAPAAAEAAPIAEEAPSVPFEMPPTLETEEPAAPVVETPPTPAEETETAFVGGIPLGGATEPVESEPAAESARVTGPPLMKPETEELIPRPDAQTRAAIPLGAGDEEAGPNDAKVLDLDEPVEDSAYVIPGLAEPEAETEPEPDVDAQPLIEGGPLLDLDSEEPEKKPEDKA